MSEPARNCPCTSGLTYEQCCQPYLNREQIPATAEQMMRARYTAHAMAEIEFIIASHHPDSAGEINRDNTYRWAEESEWLGMEVLSQEKGQPHNSSGTIEFIAHYIDRKGKRHRHHEISFFSKVEGEWRFRDAQAPKVQQKLRGNAKVGRNDPCPCGSGNKYKKCCGR